MEHIDDKSGSTLAHRCRSAEIPVWTDARGVGTTRNGTSGPPAALGHGKSRRTRPRRLGKPSSTDRPTSDGDLSRSTGAASAERGAVLFRHGGQALLNWVGADETAAKPEQRNNRGKSRSKPTDG